MAKNYAMKRIGVERQYENVNKEERRRQELAYQRDRQIRGATWSEIDPRRRQEWMEGGMIREDHTAIANLPMQPVHTEYPSINHASVYTPDYVVQLFNDDRD